MTFKPLLIDLDGVLKLGNSPAPDVKEFFNFIEKSKIPSCILSNSTLNTGQMVNDFFSSNNILLTIPAITAFDATLAFVKKKYSRVQVYCRENLIHHFNGMIDTQNPEAIVIGDIADKWNYQIVNDIFKKVMSGADLIAMHKNKYWDPQGELMVDSGAFITGIEYSSSIKAVVIGKPSPHYFKAAIEKISGNIDEGFYMIGDDLENDIIAAQDLGGTGILIFTGKTKFPIENQFIQKPNYQVHTLQEVINLLTAKLI